MSEPDPIQKPSSAGIELAPGVFAPDSTVRFQYSRSSGPGGQNVNKVNTRAELWVTAAAITGLTDAAHSRLRQFAGKRLTDADEIHLTSCSHRSHEVNRPAGHDHQR